MNVILMPEEGGSSATSASVKNAVPSYQEFMDLMVKYTLPDGEASLKPSEMEALMMVKAKVTHEKWDTFVSHAKELNSRMEVHGASPSVPKSASSAPNAEAPRVEGPGNTTSENAGMAMDANPTFTERVTSNASASTAFYSQPGTVLNESSAGNAPQYTPNPSESTAFYSQKGHIDYHISKESSPIPDGLLADMKALSANRASPGSDSKREVSPTNLENISTYHTPDVTPSFPTAVPAVTSVGAAAEDKENLALAQEIEKEREALRNAERALRDERNRRIADQQRSAVATVLRKVPGGNPKIPAPDGSVGSKDAATSEKGHSAEATQAKPNTSEPVFNPSRSGFLIKLETKTKAWLKRYVVLKEGLLRVYKSDKEAFTPNAAALITVALDYSCSIGQSSAEVCPVVVPSEDGNSRRYPQVFEVITPAKTLVFACVDQLDLRHWILALTQTIRANTRDIDHALKIHKTLHDIADSKLDALAANDIMTKAPALPVGDQAGADTTSNGKRLSEEVAVHEGSLQRESHKEKNKWRRCYVRLVGSTMTVHNSVEDVMHRPPVLILTLSIHASIQMAYSAASKYTFEITLDGHSHRFMAASDEERMAWIRAVSASLRQSPGAQIGPSPSPNVVDHSIPISKSLAAEGIPSHNKQISSFESGDPPRSVASVPQAWNDDSGNQDRHDFDTGASPRSLGFLAEQSPPPDHVAAKDMDAMEGLLYHRQANEWKKRWGILHGRTLSLFKSPSHHAQGRTAVLELQLDSTKHVQRVEFAGREHSFGLVDSHSTGTDNSKIPSTVLAAADSESLIVWLFAFSEVAGRDSVALANSHADIVKQWQQKLTEMSESHSNQLNKAKEEQIQLEDEVQRLKEMLAKERQGRAQDHHTMSERLRWLEDKENELQEELNQNPQIRRGQGGNEPGNTLFLCDRCSLDVRLPQSREPEKVLPKPSSTAEMGSSPIRTNTSDAAVRSELETARQYNKELEERLLDLVRMQTGAAAQEEESRRQKKRLEHKLAKVTSECHSLQEQLDTYRGKLKDVVEGVAVDGEQFDEWLRSTEIMRLETESDRNALESLRGLCIKLFRDSQALLSERSAVEEEITRLRSQLDSSQDENWHLQSQLTSALDGVVGSNDVGNSSDLRRLLRSENIPDPSDRARLARLIAWRSEALEFMQKAKTEIASLKKSVARTREAAELSFVSAMADASDLSHILQKLGLAAKKGPSSARSAQPAFARVIDASQPANLTAQPSAPQAWQPKATSLRRNSDVSKTSSKPKGAKRGLAFNTGTDKKGARPARSGRSPLRVPHAPRVKLTPMRENISVFVRMKPPSENDGSCIASVKDNNTIEIAKYNDRRSFHADRIYTADKSTDDIAEPLYKQAAGVVLGIDACIVVYGETGSGKEYTLNGGTAHGSTGLIQRLVTHVFAMVDEQDKEMQFQVEIQAGEVLRESVRDLLSREKTVKARSTHTAPLTSVGLTSVEDFIEVEDLIRGRRTLVTSDTGRRALHPYTHTIFSIRVSGHHTERNETWQGTLTFVKLAGCERPPRGEAGKECSIGQKGSIALSHVITALASQDSFAPYRNSKLTKLLQDRLTENTHLFLIAHILPGDRHFIESVTTLSFADRFKMATTRTMAAGSPVSFIHRYNDRALEFERAERGRSLSPRRFATPPGSSVNRTAPVKDGDNLDKATVSRYLRSTKSSRLRARSRSSDPPLSGRVASNSTKSQGGAEHLRGSQSVFDMKLSEVAAILLQE